MSNDEMITKPTIETVLDRINALGQHLGERLQRLDEKVTGLDAKVSVLTGEVQRMGGEVQRLGGEVQRLNIEVEQLKIESQRHGSEIQALRTDQSLLRDEVASGFRKLASKMEALSDAWLEVRADIRDLNRRVDKLEERV